MFDKFASYLTYLKVEKTSKPLVEKFLLAIYNAWCLFWFVFIFLLFYPFTYLFLQNKHWHRYVHTINRIWAYLFFPIIGKPLQITHEFVPDASKTYVFVANHFSYLDVAVGMGVVKNYFAYVGKSSVSKVPMFGYMFRRHHIMVDRDRKESRSRSLVRAMKMLQEGRSIFIMPEGGIVSKHIPKMQQPFKEGAFVMAIENQVPIVPISYLNLYKIMPENLLLWGKPQIIIHRPIETKGKTKADIDALKQQVYDVIQASIDKYQNKSSV